MSTFRTCRICRRRGPNLVRTALRHHAHANCLIFTKGWDWLLRSPRLSWLVARAAAHEVLIFGRLGYEQ